MSNTHKDLQDPDPSLSNIVVSGLAIAGAMLIMVIVVAFAYLPQRVDTVVGDEMTDEERWELLRSRMDTEERELNSFDWIDRNANVVRLPIDQAMEITVARINSGEAIFQHPALVENGSEIEDERADAAETAQEEPDPVEVPEGPADGTDVEVEDPELAEDDEE